MPVIIEELTTSLELEDEAKIRKLIRDEVEQCLQEFRRSMRSGGGDVDPSDPAAAGGPQESGGG
jgi:hypothetical protein